MSRLSQSEKAFKSIRRTLPDLTINHKKMVIVEVLDSIHSTGVSAMLELEKYKRKEYEYKRFERRSRK